MIPLINQEGTNLRQKAEQFRILKENFSGTGKYEDEDEAYIMFKRYEAKVVAYRTAGKRRNCKGAKSYPA